MPSHLTQQSAAPADRHGDRHGHGHEHPGGVSGVLASVFRPHSHDAADSVDSAWESSSRGLRALTVSLLALLVTGVLQILVAVASGSVALLADSFHNGADALSALPLGAAFLLGRRTANRRYTYGYGRPEDLAGVFVVVLIAVSAVFAGWEAIRRLLDPAPVEHLGWVALAGIIGFAGNELVAIYRIRVGRSIGSAALVADGLHARTDGLTSLAVVLGAAGVALGFPLADPLIGLLITALILMVLKGAARDVFARLMDAVDPHLVEQAEGALTSTDGVRGVSGLRLRWMGHQQHADATVDVDPALSLDQAHTVAHRAEANLTTALPRVTTVLIHAHPEQHSAHRSRRLTRPARVFTSRRDRTVSQSPKVANHSWTTAISTRWYPPR